MSLLCACAPIRWVGVDGLPCHSTPFLWCLPKETVSSRQRKAPFLPRRLHHSRERYCLSGLYSSSPDLGRAWWLSERLPSPGANVGCYGFFARVVLFVGVTVVIRFRLAPKSAFLWGSTPFLCARAKKWGGMGSRGEGLLPGGTAHTHRRTRTRRKKAGGKDRRLPRRCRGDPIITCTSPAGGSPLLCFHASNFQHPARGGSREACNSRRNVASLISNVGLKGP